MSSRMLQTVLMAAALVGPVAAAEETKAALVTVFLEGGGQVVGTVTAEDEASLTVRLPSGSELKLPKGEIARVAEGPLPGSPRPDRVDPNDSRLMFAPSGRPLRRGDGYFSDHYVLFPGFAYGLSDNVSVGGGISTVPGSGLSDQLYYLNAQVGFRLSPQYAFSVGAMYAGGMEEDWDGAAILYGITSLGRPDRSLTLGLAVAATREEVPRFNSRDEYMGSDHQWRSRPVIMVGGSLRIAKQLSLVSENWLFPGEPLSEQPFGLALRFFGDRLSADVGFLFIGEVMAEGFPVPWLSFSYHFGPSRSARSRAAAMPPLVPSGSLRGR